MSPPLHFFFTSFTNCFRGKICDYTFRLKRTNIKYLSRHQTVNSVACRLQPGKSFDRRCVFQRHLWEAESLMLNPPYRYADDLLDLGLCFPNIKNSPRMSSPATRWRTCEWGADGRKELRVQTPGGSQLGTVGGSQWGHALWQSTRPV